MRFSPESGSPLLLARNLSMAFTSPEGLHVLDRLTFSIQEGEFVTILGPSGCGKSTLLRLLAGLRAPTAGEVLFRGQPVQGPLPDTGIVFQKANLMPWRTVLENILLPLQIDGYRPAEADKLAREMISLVGLPGFEDSLPQDLSGGMAQRVAIARALVHDAGLLLMDEPFGSLDALTREQMGAELLRIWQAHRITAVLVTHSISEAVLLSDRVLVMTPRPARIQLDLKVELPRPRDPEMRYMQDFGQIARQLRAAIGTQSGHTGQVVSVVR
jgi:NitT/TauT family transport system ATP-binding protein